MHTYIHTNTHRHKRAHIRVYIYIYIYVYVCVYIYIFIFIFENELFPTTAVQQRQHVDAVGCGTFFSGLISMFVFDILQIPSGCNQIYSGCIARTFIQLATGLPLTSV